MAGWALAQQPVLLRGLTIEQAAAPHDTLVALIVAVLAGGAILFPSLALLFGLVLRGELDRAAPARGGREYPGKALLAGSATGLLARCAGACLIAGFGLLTVANAPWAHGLGVVLLLGFVVLGFLASSPAKIACSSRDETGD